MESMPRSSVNKVKNLIGSIGRMSISSGQYCYGRMLNNLDYAFYDYRTSFKDDEIEEIVKKDILFTTLVHFKALDQSDWVLIGNIPLDARHKKQPMYFHPDLTNLAIYDYTVSKLQETLKYKTFESDGLQYGSVYSANHIEDRLRDYYAGKDYKGITNLIAMLSNLKAAK